MEYLFKCSHNSIFFLELSVWSWNHLAKKYETELKNMKESSSKHSLSSGQKKTSS